LTEEIMAHPYHHSLSSVKKWGGSVADYQPIHDWFDQSKQIIADFRHRALRHHAEGIFMAETIFGSTITLSTGRVVPVRWIGVQEVPSSNLGGPTINSFYINASLLPHEAGRTRTCEKCE
jgi:hypothetical protein